MGSDTRQTPVISRGPIIIARHGRPALDRTKGPRIGWQAYVDWWSAYETGGLEAGQAAPAELRAMVKDAETLFTSGRLRAQQTMEAAAPGRSATIDDLFNEAPLPPPRIGMARLLPKTWNVIARIAWLTGHALGDDETVSQSWDRASRAAGVLHEASAKGKVFLAAHGWFNRMIRKELRRLGWTCKYNGGDQYWSWRVYEYPGSGTGRSRIGD